MGHGGFEPPTNCLRGNCSAVELMTQVSWGRVDNQHITRNIRAIYCSQTAVKESARLEGFEPSTIRLEGGCSIH